MSVFVFNQETIGIIRYVLAIQRFGEYSVGPKELNGYLCALAFERVLIQTGLKYPKFQKENQNEISKHEIIHFLKQKNLISPTVANKLDVFLSFHASVIQKGSQMGLEKLNTKAKEILQFLCAEAGLNQNEELKNRAFDEIASLKSETEKEESNLAESDFDNLDQLYKKSSALQLAIEKRLKVPLKRAQLSVFAPNTGGICLPFVCSESSDLRAPADGASLAVTLTPISIRVGLNFGSYAHKYRVKYYELILSGQLMGLLESLSRKATGYCLCDTFWHYHIRNIQSLQWCLTLYGSTRVAIENAIAETKQLEGNPLTANQYLISKVTVRRPEDFTYVINGLVNEASNTLNELYPLLERIEKESQAHV